LNFERYARLIRLSGVGEEGFEKIRKAKIALVGCGTLGCAYAQNLLRMGIGHLRLIDRDIVEEHNLTTQILFDEEDARQVYPKAIAAKKHLRAINANCEIQVHPAELNWKNAEELLSGVDLILDATDNFETRFLINDFSLKFNLPWIYTGVVGYLGLCLAVIPGSTACLRCLMDKPPEAGTLPTCETVGVWAPAAQATAAAGLTEALKLLLGKEPESILSEIDLESGRWRKVKVKRQPDCPACVSRHFDYLEGRTSSQATQVCGRNMVHLSPEREMDINLLDVAKGLPDSLEVAVSESLLRLRASEAEIYLFPDGRAFVKGVSDPNRARTIYNRYFSS